MLKLAYDSLANLLQPVGLLWAALCVLTVRRLLLKRGKDALYTGVLAAVVHMIGGTPLPAALLARLERPYDPTGPHAFVWPAHADAVVMLGGTHGWTPRSPLHFGFGEASDRVLLAIEFIREKRAPTLVLGGSFYELNGVKRPDSELLTQWISAWRLPAGEVVTLGGCADTHDEAVKTAKLARERGWRTLLLVSSGYHLARGAALFHKVGLNVVPCGAEFLGLDAVKESNQWMLVPGLRGFELMHSWCHEEIAWIYYWCRGWV